MNFAMKSLLAAMTLGLIAGHAFSADAPSPAAPEPVDSDEAPPYVWFNGVTDATHSSLVYGSQESAEDTALSLICTRGSGTVSLFFAESGDKLKAGQQVNLTVSAGTAKLTVKGKTTANEMAGGTSTEAELSADAPLFTAMTETAGLLELDVEGTKGTVPLSGIGTKASEFAAACRKK
jgi:hypothetical protein